jgi:hypothetical protein
MSGVVNGFNTTVGAVGNVGNAASVAADQMPVFNNTAVNGVNSFNNQAGAMNDTAAQGVNAFNNQAGAERHRSTRRQLFQRPGRRIKQDCAGKAVAEHTAAHLVVKGIFEGVALFLGA